MSESRFVTTARVIADHRLRRTPLPALEDSKRPRDELEGYQVQREVHRILDTCLGAIVGHKIGATNPQIQAKLGVHNPCAGGVYASTVHHGSAELNFKDYVRPGVECEIAFRLGRDLSPRNSPYNREDLMDAIDACMVSMEIIDNRYENLAQIHVPTLIADDTLDAGVVLGQPVTDWRSLDLSALSGTLHLNGVEVTRGTGANVLGHPLNAIIWIANLLSQQGYVLGKGEFVSTGSIADIQWAARGDRLAATVDKLGSVQAIFR
jgi:2-keto-4-pentenoate hydratase